MSEIKRYYLIDGDDSVLLAPATDGEWVRWEDVQELHGLLDAQAEELRLMQEQINRLVESYRNPNR
jgi:hypothetical protein